MARYELSAAAFFNAPWLANDLQGFLNDIDNRLSELEGAGTGSGVTKNDIKRLQDEIAAVRGIAESAYNRKCPSVNTQALVNRIGRVESGVRRLETWTGYHRV